MRRCAGAICSMTGATVSCRLKKCVKRGGKSFVFPSVGGGMKAAHILSPDEQGGRLQRAFSTKINTFSIHEEGGKRHGGFPYRKDP